jgi:hypothetical protein
MLFQFNLWTGSNNLEYLGKRKTICQGEIEAPNLILALEKTGLRISPGRHLDIEVKRQKRKKRFERPPVSKIEKEGFL